jgi:transcriptional regulator with XRE-family HTH domain
MSKKKKPAPPPKPIHPLTRWRFENGRMSLAALGKKVKASAPHLSDIENHTKNPSIDLLTRLCDLTSLPMEAIASEDLRRVLARAKGEDMARAV